MVEQTFALCTLGCKVNQEEGMAIANLFKEHGWQQVDFKAVAGVYIVNSCTVTHLADRKSRQMLRQAMRRNPQALIVATGCYAQTGQAELAAIQGVHLIVGTNDRPRILALVTENLKNHGADRQPVLAVSPVAEAHKFMEIGNLNNDTTRQRAYLKIEDGCSQFCSYCIIPYARGPVRSKPMAEIIAEAKALSAKGYQEIVLTGIHTGAYGTDLGAGSNLAALVAKLVAISHLPRLRLGSIEPQEVSDDLIALAGDNPKICPHFHIPLQACDDKVLKAMNRHYTVEFYGRLLAKIRRVLPNAAITTDVIVGFPGESSEAFEGALQTIAGFGFSAMHIFPYSARKGTPAADYPSQIGAAIKEERIKKLNAIAAKSSLAYQKAQLGKTLKVLLEQTEVVGGKKMLTGHSENYLPVAMPSGVGANGDLLVVVIDDIAGDYLLARPAKNQPTIDSLPF